METSITSSNYSLTAQQIRVLANGRICAHCYMNPRLSIVSITTSIKEHMEKGHSIHKICSNCAKHSHNVILPHIARTHKPAKLAKNTENPYHKAFQQPTIDTSSSSCIDIESCQSLDCPMYYE